MNDEGREGRYDSLDFFDLGSINLLYPRIPSVIFLLNRLNIDVLILNNFDSELYIIIILSQ